MRYEIDVNFDDETADVGREGVYFDVLSKYQASGIGHDKTKTSTITIRSEKPLNVEQLARDLGDIKILNVRQTV